MKNSIGGVFRLRDIEKVVGNPEKNIESELEGEYFYFSDSEQLNDPLEGHLNLFWQGDYVAWIGLFKNYAWQLFHTVYYLMPFNPPMHILEMLFLTRTEITLKGTKLPGQRSAIEEVFSNNSKVRKVAEILAEYNIRLSYDELSAVLILIHKEALESVSMVIKTETDMGDQFGILDKLTLLVERYNECFFEELLHDTEKLKFFFVLKKMISNSDLFFMY